MKELELKYLERLEGMLDWRVSKGTTTHHEAEATALAWAVKQLRDCLEGGE